MRIAGNLAYVRIGGFQIVNISDPSAPFELARFGLGSNDSAIELAGTTLYRGGKAGFGIFDVSDPSAPALIGDFTAALYVFDLQVVGTLAYLASDAGLVITDVSDPAALAEVPADSNHFICFNVEVVGSIAYVAGNDAPTTGPCTFTMSRIHKPPGCSHRSGGGTGNFLSTLGVTAGELYGISYDLNFASYPFYDLVDSITPLSPTTYRIGLNTPLHGDSSLSRSARTSPPSAGNC